MDTKVIVGAAIVLVVCVVLIYFRFRNAKK